MAELVLGSAAGAPLLRTLIGLAKDTGGADKAMAMALLGRAVDVFQARQVLVNPRNALPPGTQYKGSHETAAKPHARKPFHLIARKSAARCLAARLRRHRVASALK